MVLAAAVMVLALAPHWDGVPRLELYGKHATMRVTPLSPPAERRAGRLTWLAGYRLQGADRAFGGFSALAVRPLGRGHRITLLGDGGNLAAFTLGPDGRPGDGRVRALDGPGTGWKKRDRDSESLVLAPDGRAWIGYENSNAIWRYAPGFARAERSARPPAMRDWPANGGAEAMVRLRDGRFLVLSEEGRWPGRPGRAAVMFAGDPAERPRDGFAFSYVPAPGHRVSDAAVLPGGDILVLERAWRLPLRFRFRIALMKAAAPTPGAVVRAATVARLGPPWPIDNYEGIAVTRERGRTIVWLVSDDDNMGWRSSYLLKLRLD